MFNRVIRLALCSTLLLGAASASLVETRTNNQNTVIRGNGITVNDSNQSPQRNGKREISTREPRNAARNGNVTVTSSSSTTTTSNGTTSSSNSDVSIDCDTENNTCTVVINGVTYGPYVGSNLIVSNNEIIVDGNVVQKF